MGKWCLVINFEVDTAEAAEAHAFKLLENRDHKGTALSYLDPISGEWKLWAEPIRRPTTYSHGIPVFHPRPEDIEIKAADPDFERLLDEEEEIARQAHKREEDAMTRPRDPNPAGWDA